MNIENQFLSYINKHVSSKDKLFYLKQTTFTVPDCLCYVAFLYNEEEYIVKINKIIIDEENDQYIKEQIIDLMPKEAHYRLAELFDPSERRIALTNFVSLENSSFRKEHKAFCEDVNQNVNFDIDHCLNKNFDCSGCIFFVHIEQDPENSVLEETYCKLGYEENMLHSGCVDCPGFVSNDNNNSRLKFS